MKRKLISFIVPAYNEEACVDALFTRLTQVFATLSAQYDCEAVIVENGSDDATYEKLQAIHAQDGRFKILKLARNVGTDGGMTAGLQYAKGDAAVLLCADLEDPPELVVEFAKKWEEGFHNVYGVTGKRPNGWLRSLNSKLFYWIINKLTNNMVPPNASDFRLIDKKLYSAINRMNEHNRFLRGMVAWTGFKSCGVPYHRGTRAGGRSKAYTWVVVQFAIRSIFSFSYVPLRMVTLLGMCLSFMSFVAIAILTAKFFIYGVPFPGFGTIICLMLLLFGFLFIVLGIISEYIGMTFEEVKGRPLFIVDEAVGL
jgi:dolichol-phosphate mannosyltransferase